MALYSLAGVIQVSKSLRSHVDLIKCSQASSPTSDEVHANTVSLAVAVKTLSYKGV